MEDKERDKTKGASGQADGVSRRKWLIDVGKAAAFAGIAGKAGPLEAGTLSGPMTSGGEKEGFPPGLYRPSSGHLGRALEEESPFHSIPSGCQVDFIRPRTGPFEPQFFSPDEYKMIRRLTALMQGETAATSADSGKSSTGNIVDEVAEWVDLRTHSFGGIYEAAERLTPEQVAVAKAYNGAPLLHRIKTSNPQRGYRDGLAWIAKESRRLYQREFIELEWAQQSAILERISDEPAKKGVKNDGTRFFRLLKADIVSGFYTSRIGLKELDYKGNRFYAESPGCTSPDHIPLKSGR